MPPQQFCLVSIHKWHEAIGLTAISDDFHFGGMLREFIRYAKSHDKVWFATAGEVAKWYRENYRDAQVEEWPNFYHAGRRGKVSDLSKL